MRKYLPHPHSGNTTFFYFGLISMCLGLLSVFVAEFVLQILCISSYCKFWSFLNRRRVMLNAMVWFEVYSRASINISVHYWETSLYFVSIILSRGKTFFGSHRFSSWKLSETFQSPHTLLRQRTWKMRKMSFPSLTASYFRSIQPSFTQGMKHSHPLCITFFGFRPMEFNVLFTVSRPHV